MDHEPTIAVHARSADVDPDLRRHLVDCWVEVTNSGGAVGFPFPPVSRADVEPAFEALLRSLSESDSGLLVASIDGQVAGWVTVAGNAAPVAAHWATVQRLQTASAYRGRGVASALMARVRQVARDELGIEQLWLSVRAGLGLEAFYERLGWVVTGRHPGALRLGPDDHRDEVFMVLRPL